MLRRGRIIAYAVFILASILAYPAISQNAAVFQDNFRSGQGGDHWQGGSGFEQIHSTDMIAKTCPGVSGYALRSEPMSRRPVRVTPGRYKIIVRFHSPRAHSLTAARRSIQLGIRMTLVGYKSFTAQPASQSGYPSGCQIYSVEDVVSIDQAGDLSVGLRYENPDQRIGGKSIRITEAALFALDTAPGSKPARELVEIPNAGRACATARYAWSCAGSQRVADRGVMERKCGGADQRDCCLVALTSRKRYCASAGIERFDCACRTFVSIGQTRQPKPNRSERDESDNTAKVAERADDLLDAARFAAKTRRDGDEGARQRGEEFFEGLYEDALARYDEVVSEIRTEQTKLYAREKRVARLLEAAKGTSGAPAAAKAQELRGELADVRSKQQTMRSAHEKAREAYYLLRE